jgi:hypothetical protein
MALLNLKNLFRKNLVVLGAGQLGELLLKLWPKEIPRPTLFLDNRRAGNIDGIAIESTLSHQFSDSNTYVLAFFKDDPESINKLFREVINQEIVTAYDLLTSFEPDLFSNGWIGESNNLDKASANLRFLADERSRNILESVIQWRYARFLSYNVELIDENSKYDLTRYGVMSDEYEFICDGGSYDMSFVLKQLKNGINAETIVIVEPDVSRYTEVKKIYSEAKETLPAKTVFHLDNRALWSSTGVKDFYSNGLLSARVARFPTASCVSVRTVSLGDLMQEYKISPSSKALIKLHIEGAEWPVVESSIEMLLSFDRIDLLINLSHDEDSLLNIPQTLGLSKKFDLFLDSHALFGEGLTLFAKSKSYSL